MPALPQEPEFEIQASPLGLSGLAGELPGLISTLRGALLKVRGGCCLVVLPGLISTLRGALLKVRGGCCLVVLPGLISTPCC